MYLRPIAPFNRTMTLESDGSGLTLSCSFMLTTAMGRPEASCDAVTLLTNPTCEPPIRTSALRVTSLASRICTLTVYRGTNGSPWLAL